MTSVVATPASERPPATPGVPSRPPRRRWRQDNRRLPRLLVLGALVATVAVVLPLVFLVTQAVQVGWGTLDPLLFRGLTAQLIWNTVSLTVVVTALCAVIGTVSAWFIERTQLPGRRYWAVLVVIPLGIPDFVVSFGWRAIFPAFGGFWAAVLVMTLAVYPLVFLPVAASLRNADPAQEEVARSLGLGRMATFWKVTVGQARLAILGGSVLVALVVLAEFGAFEILGFNTLTTEIFTEFTVGLNQTAACALSLILVAARPRDPSRRGGRPGPWPGSPAGSRHGATDPSPTARACHAGRAGRGGIARRAGTGGARRLHHLPHRAGRELDVAARLLVGRGGAHLHVRRVGRCHRHRGRTPDRAALRALPPARGARSSSAPTC